MFAGKGNYLLEIFYNHRCDAPSSSVKEKKLFFFVKNTNL
jgi:hypothetical protein